MSASSGFPRVREAIVVGEGLPHAALHLFLGSRSEQGNALPVASGDKAKYLIIKLGGKAALHVSE
jgi:hypothetical protein